MFIQIRKDLNEEDTANVTRILNGKPSTRVHQVRDGFFNIESIYEGLPVQFYEPTSQLYHARHQMDESKSIVIALTVDSGTADSVDHSDYSFNPFSDEEHAAYTPVLATYRLKSLDTEIDRGTFTSDKVTREFSVVLDTNCLNASAVLIPGTYEHIRTSELELVTDEDNRQEPAIWSDSASVDIPINSDNIREQLRVRYAFFTQPRAGLLNVVLDSYVPHLMYNANLNPERLQQMYTPPKTAVTISPWFASILGVKQMPMSDILAVLGHTEKGLRLLFKRVRTKKLSLVLLGYGGTSVNTITWLTEIAKLVNAPQIFKSIMIFEPDELEISNLFRFPIDPRQNIREFSKDSTFAPKLSLIDSSINRLSAEVHQSSRYYDPAVINHSTRNIYYGAPDIATRAKLSPLGNFISATHADQSCRIDLNPAQNTALQVESYGVISLATFFMNQVQMAISFLDLLASDQDLMEQDKTILEYSFDGVAKLPASRQYNFQLEHTGLVALPTENTNV